MTRRRFGASHDAPGKGIRHTENDSFRPNGPNATRSRGRRESSCHPDAGRETSGSDGAGEPSRASTRAHRARCFLFFSLRSSHRGFFAWPDELARIRKTQQSTLGCRSAEISRRHPATKVAVDIAASSAPLIPRSTFQAVTNPSNQSPQDVGQIAFTASEFWLSTSQWLAVADLGRGVLPGCCLPVASPAMPRRCVSLARLF